MDTSDAGVLEWLYDLMPDEALRERLCVFCYEAGFHLAVRPGYPWQVMWVCEKCFNAHKVPCDCPYYQCVKWYEGGFGNKEAVCT